MKKLADMDLVRGDNTALTEEQIEELLPQVPAWQLVQREGVRRLERMFQFRNFAEALAFTNEVGALAEVQNHHPAILTRWGNVAVSWWTHSVNGLHQNDFIMAAKTDELYAKE
jgi:4a-hydroxytetrahydrobiopterin dehydratase